MGACARMLCCNCARRRRHTLSWTGECCAMTNDTTGTRIAAYGTYCLDQHLHSHFKQQRLVGYSKTTAYKL